MHVLRNALERSVEAEGHVPDLPGEDEQDGSGFDSQLPAGEQGYHRQHDTGQETEHGNGLQDIEQRNHEALSPGIVGGNVSVDEREREARRREIEL